MHWQCQNLCWASCIQNLANGWNYFGRGPLGAPKNHNPLCHPTYANQFRMECIFNSYLFERKPPLRIGNESRSHLLAAFLCRFVPPLILLFLLLHVRMSLEINSSLVYGAWINGWVQQNIHFIIWMSHPVGG